MNINYITSTFLPDVNGGSIRAYHFSKYLRKFHHNVFIVTARTRNAEKVEILNDFNVKRCLGKTFPSIVPGIGYVPSFTFNSYVLSKKEEIDVIHGTSPYLGGAISAYISHKLTKIPFIFEVRDPYVRPFEFEENTRGYVSEGSFKGGLVKKIIKKICSSASKIVVTNPAIKNEMMRIYDLKNEDIEIIYNGADLEEIKTIKAKKFEDFTILYAGRINKGRALSNLVEALKDIDAKLVIAGSGDISFIKKKAEKLNCLDKICFLGVLSHDDVLAYEMGADLLFLGLEPSSKLLRYALPSKVFEYMATGKPVLSISPRGGDLENLLKEYNCGITSSPDTRKIVDHINALISDNNLAKYYGKNGLNAVKEKFNREYQTKLLITIYESAIE